MTFESIGSFPASEITKIMTEHNDKLNTLENKFTMLAQGHEKVKVSMNTTAESPGHAIVHAAKEFNADLIVIGSRGLGMIKRKILGSVSDYVLHHSHVPVCICPV